MRALWTGTLLIGTLLGVAGPARAAEAQQEFEPLDTRGLTKATGMLEQQDYRNGLNLLFLLLRHGDKEIVRSEARERLERLGLTPRDIFLIEIPAMKPEELEVLLQRVTRQAAINARADNDLYYAQQVLAASVVVRTNANGEWVSDIQTEAVLSVLQTLLQHALGDNPTAATKAMAMLEGLGIYGSRVDTLRSAIADKKLPPELATELLAARIVYRLRQYYETLRDARDGAAVEESPRRRHARAHGVALLKFLEKNHPQASVFKRQIDAVDFFRDLMNTQPEKF